MRPVRLIPLVLVGTLALGACGGDGDKDAAIAPAKSTATKPAAGSPTTRPGVAGDSASAQGAVSANTASRSQIAAALAAAGVDNADRWAGEVIEYRPYESASDTARLREELAKYRPSASTVDRILGALVIP